MDIHSYFSLFSAALNVFAQHHRSLELPECRFPPSEQQPFAVECEDQGLKGSTRGQYDTMWTTARRIGGALAGAAVLAGSECCRLALHQRAALSTYTNEIGLDSGREY